MKLLKIFMNLNQNLFYDILNALMSLFLNIELTCFIFNIHFVYYLPAQMFGKFGSLNFGQKIWLQVLATI